MLFDGPSIPLSHTLDYQLDAEDQTNLEHSQGALTQSDSDAILPPPAPITAPLRPATQSSWRPPRSIGTLNRA